MKNLVLIVVLLVGIVSVCYALSVNETQAVGQAVKTLEQVRDNSANLYTLLGGAKAKLTSLNTDYGTVLDAADKTKFATAISNMNTVISDLNTLISNIDTNFPIIE